MPTFTDKKRGDGLDLPALRAKNNPLPFITRVVKGTNVEKLVDFVSSRCEHKKEEISAVINVLGKIEDNEADFISLTGPVLDAIGCPENIHPNRITNLLCRGNRKD